MELAALRRWSSLSQLCASPVGMLLYMRLQEGSQAQSTNTRVGGTYVGEKIH